jgi:hypothetical protein
LTELHEILALHHLLRYIETKYRAMYLLEFASYYPEQFTPDMAMQVPLPKPPDHTAAQEMKYLRIWRERFDIAAYTSLLFGAVFARAYNLPFFGNSTSPGWRRILELSPRRDDRSWEAEVESFTRQFPAYDLLGTLTAQDKLFGPIADWFLSSTLKELQEDARDHASVFRIWNQQSHQLFDISPGSQTLPWDKSLPSKYTRCSREEGDDVFAGTMRAIEMFECLLHATTRPDIMQSSAGPLHLRVADAGHHGERERQRLSYLVHSRRKRFRCPRKL